MATIDPSSDTVVMSKAEYYRLIGDLQKETKRELPFDYPIWVQLAKLAFDETISTSATRTPWTVLQEQLIAWQNVTYGAQPFERQVLGIAEEFGELDEAETSDGRRDGIADITVFSSQLAAIWRLDLGKLIEAAVSLIKFGFKLRSRIAAVGRLSHVALKTLQGIRGMDDEGTARLAIGTAIIDVLAHALLALHAEHGPDNWTPYATSEDLYAVVKPVADEVMKRTKKLPQVSP